MNSMLAYKTLGIVTLVAGLKIGLLMNRVEALEKQIRVQKQISSRYEIRICELVGKLSPEDVAALKEELTTELEFYSIVNKM